MKRTTLLLPAVVIALLAGVTDCGEVESPQPGTTKGLKVVPDNQRAVSSRIGPGGGTLTTQSQSGSVLVLSVPPGAVGADTTITLTPVHRIDGLPDGARLIVGVQLAPEGLTLRKPATLTAAVPESVSSSRLFAFGWTQDGRSPYLTPFTRSDDGTDVAQVGLFHFSGAALVQSSDAATIQNWKGNGSDEYIALLATLYRHAAAAGVLPWHDSGYQTLFSNLILDWYENAVRPQLTAAGQAPEGWTALYAAEDVTRECIKWKAAISKWENDYFRGLPDAYLHWDGRYESIGLSSDIEWSIDQAVTLFNTLVERGIQDPACLLAADDCVRQEFLERALIWVELTAFMDGIETQHSTKVKIPQLDTYCDGYVLRHIMLIVIGDEAIQLEVGEQYPLYVGAADLLGNDLSHLAVWKSSRTGIATIDTNGVVTAVAAGQSVVTASDKDGCIADSVTVTVVPENLTFVLSGTISLAGAWRNGCLNNCWNTCPIDDAYLTSYTGTYDIEITVQGGTGLGEAVAAGSISATSCCEKNPESCNPVYSSWTSHTSVSHFVDGNMVSVYFAYTDFPQTSIGLSLNGAFHAPPGTGVHVFMGTATIKPFVCGCEITDNFTLN